MRDSLRRSQPDSPGKPFPSSIQSLTAVLRVLGRVRALRGLQRLSARSSLISSLIYKCDPATRRRMRNLIEYKNLNKSLGKSDRVFRDCFSSLWDPKFLWDSGLFLKSVKCYMVPLIKSPGLT